MAELELSGSTRIWLGDKDITDIVSAIHVEPDPWQAALLAKTPTSGS